METHPPLADELAAQTARIADLLLSRDTVKDSVQALAHALQETIPGTAGAGASLMDTRGQGSAWRSGVTPDHAPSGADPHAPGRVNVDGGEAAG